MRARQDHLSLNRAAFQGPALLTNINVVMGRPAKNVNHPLVRLRRKLSDWSAHKVTRQDLAKKAGIPESSLRDIETGRYKLTPAVATKISFATGVDPQSLLDGDDPLLDLLRQPFSKESPRWSEYAEWSEEYRGAREQLFFALLDTAEEKKIARLIYFSFENWLTTTIEAFGLNDLFAQKLTDRFTLFDPYFVSDEFFPKNQRVAEKWSYLE
jgi:transcriptional regulator with XRE-family HTH domain